MNIYSTEAGEDGYVLIAGQQLGLDAAIDIEIVARLFDVSRVTVWRMTADGRIPEPFYPRDRLPRWTLREILAAREALRMSPREAKAVSRTNRLASRTQSPDAEPEPVVNKPPAAQPSRQTRRRTVQLAKVS
jgi:hypothetical protein